MTKPRVLFLCTANSARSQMAEGFLRHLADDRFAAASAGIEPSRVHPLAIAVMHEVGIDISGHCSKAVGGLLGQHFAYLITVCDGARERCPIFPDVSIRLHWALQDPAAASGSDAERLAVFRRSRDEIGERVRAFLAQRRPDQ